MTDETHDTSADHMTVIAQRMRGFTELRQYADDVDTLVDERGTIAARLAEVEAERDRQYDENVHRIAEQAKAEACAEAAEAKLAVARDALGNLRKSAALLQQNAEGCAVNHYGEDFEIHGLPGWLADTRASIDRAAEALALLDTDQPKEGQDNA